MATLGNATGGDPEANARAAKVRELVQAYTELEQINRRMMSMRQGTNDNEISYLRARRKELQELIADEDKYTQKQREAAESSKKVQQEQEKTEHERQKAIDKQIESIRKRESEEEKAAKKAVELAQKKAEAEQKAAAVAQARAEKQAAHNEQAKVNELIKLYTDYERIQQRLASNSVGDAERTQLQAQAQAIQEKINNSEKYTDAQRQAAQESDKVAAAVAKTAQAQAKASDAAEKAAKKSAEQTDRQIKNMENLTNRMISMFSTMVMMKGIKELWQNAIEYANAYYDQLNEIQVVTMKSDGDISNLSSQYRQMAKEMSVSSREIASAATTFYRQGLDDQAVEQRLKYTTQYAKVAAMNFTEAADLITATANSMSNDIQGDIQRVVDVFVYLGDNAGTSAAEVGTAMQKAAASAGQFGMSFEWLGAYIATVSETTRQAAEVVGTSLNAIIARLHSIKTTGFNQEDETKINDVAKALGTLNITLLDTEGNWRDMTDIFNDVAAQWQDLDGKQKSYLATALAGTRQQNTFLALMNDLSKGLEGGSRAWELYTGAMNASGTVAQKYDVWEKSVEAANGRLHASLESLYSTIWSGDMTVGFKNLAAGFIDALAAGNKFLGGLGPIIIGIGALTAAIIASGNGLSGVLLALEAHPIILAVTGVIAVLTGLVAAIGSVSQAASKAYAQATEDMARAQQNIEKLTGLKDQLSDMETSIANGNKELSDYTGLLAQLETISPTASAAIASMKDGAITAKEGIQILNEELER